LAHLLGLRSDPGHGLAADVHHRVGHALSGGVVYRMPAEQVAVELLRGVLVGGGEVGPGERPG
jgi:hypothetical protein